MSSSTRSRWIVLIALVLGLLALREASIRRHEADVDDWPRRDAV